jgi:PAS domain S-box-containing protein
VIRDGTLQYANAAARAIEGWKLRPGKQTPPPLSSLARQSLKQRRQLQKEVAIGGRIWWMTVVPIAPEFYVNIYCRDVTERRDAERALRESEARFRGLAEAMPQLVWSAGASGELDYCNSRTFEYGGVKLADIEGWKWGSFVHPDDVKSSSEGWRRAIKTKKAYVIEQRLRRRDGQFRWHLTRAVPVRDAEGRVTRWIGTSTDIHDHKLAEQALRQTRDYLENKVLEGTAELTRINLELADARRLSDIGTLAATVAHELRNPLAAIRMATYNVRRKARDLPVEGHLETIDRKIDESDQIINNLLFYSRLRVPNYEKVDMRALLTDNISAAKSQFMRKTISVRRDLKCLTGVYLELDPLQMREVFSNVLNNAFDALGDGRGEIEVCASLTDESAAISVRDTGSGVDAEFVEHVFEPFFTTKAKGTGLGLTVCKQIVELHGGTIGFESKKGGGTTVTVILPRARRSNGKESTDR